MVEILAKKYDEKYKNNGDVASKLTIEEATFRDIQERKLELFNAIVKINEGGNADGLLQDRVNQIQSDLDELVTDLNANCKQYGLRAKPTSLVELPFGWQSGIQEGAADWDENWDKFDDEEFLIVKDLTIDVENIIAPPKSKSPSISSQKVSQEEISPVVNNSPKTFTESELPHANSENGSVKSPPSSPLKDPWGSPPPSQEFSLPKFVTYDDYDAKDNESDHDGVESTIFSEKNADEHQWGDDFNKHDDAYSIWSSESVDKESGDNKSNQDFFFGSETFGLNPIRTGSGSPSASSAYGNENGAFFDSVPPSATSTYGNRGPFFDSAPSSATSVYGKDRSPFFDSVPPSATSVYGKDRSPFFDSVPGTPSFDSGFSPRYSEGLDKSFAYNNFDSFESQGNFARFDSMRSSQDSEYGGFKQQENLSKFDSFRSTSDFDHSQGFLSFDNTDAFGTGSFKSSENNPTVRSSDNWSSF
ncbi:hypothetical protein ZOSMA_82G00500 [Zostera marina]|uniref:Calcium-binding EF hand family protein n=1 Tax=Zostera marina TaxID=29655 RepID=A0A0K9NP38_ZOSMR|nr:hypothetical protein ZOSMA_82G00500 [Zostera marina]